MIKRGRANSSTTSDSGDLGIEVSTIGMLFDDAVSYVIEQGVLVRRVLHLSHFAQVVDREASALQVHGNKIKLCD